MGTLAVLNRTDQGALEEFRERATEILGDQLLRMALFGSKAAGTSTPESDIDVWVVVKDSALVFKDRILDAAFDVNLKHGVYISPRIMSQSVVENRVWSRTLFLRNLQEESLPL